MTTFSVHYVLTGPEVPVYRRILEIWASGASGKSKEFAELLLKETCDPNGEPSARVEEYIGIERLGTLWKTLEVELKRMRELEKANNQKPFEEQDSLISREVHLLENISEKVRATEISSRYHP